MRTLRKRVGSVNRHFKSMKAESMLEENTRWTVKIVNLRPVSQKEMEYIYSKLM